jgi:hypothetical protein
MIQASGRAGLLLKTLLKLWLTGILLAHHLDGHWSLQIGVKSLKDSAHTPTANNRLNPVRIYPLPN